MDGGHRYQPSTATRAFAIADVAARATVIRVCKPASGRHDSVEWFDLNSAAKRHQAELEEAVAYLEERGDEPAYRLIRSRAFTRMVRFERKS